MKRYFIAFLLFCGPAFAESELYLANASNRWLRAVVTGTTVDGEPFASNFLFPEGAVARIRIPDGTYTLDYAYPGGTLRVATDESYAGKGRTLTSIAQGSFESAIYVAADQRIPFSVHSWAFVSGLTLAMLLAIWAWTQNAFNESLG